MISRARRSNQPVSDSEAHISADGLRIAKATARKRAPWDIVEEAEQEAAIRVWKAEHKGQPTQSAATGGVIDFLRTELHLRNKTVGPQFIPLSDAAANTASMASRDRSAFEERALRTLYNDWNWTQREIAAAVKRSLPWVQRRFHFYGIQSRPACRRTVTQCFCGRPSYKRKDNGWGGVCYFHHRVRQALYNQRRTVQQRIKKGNSHETTTSRSIAG